MASFDGHSFCARCCNKGKGSEPCVGNKDTPDCKLCNSLTSEQHAQLVTPSYELKKEKREAMRLDSTTPADDSSLVDPARVSVIGVVGESPATQSPALPPEKKVKKDKPTARSKKAIYSSTDTKISEMDKKWSEYFTGHEALIMSKFFQLTFSSDFRVIPHSQSENLARDTEPL